MKTSRIIAASIAAILIVVVLILFFSGNIEGNFLAKKCYSMNEFESKCNELCDIVAEEFCFDKLPICDGIPLSCLDINISCATMDCFEPIAE